MKSTSVPSSQEQYDQGGGLAYSEMNSVFKTTTQIVDPLIWHVLGDLKGKSILDLGCGWGDYLEVMSKSGAKELVGVDISREMIDCATKRFEPGTVELIVGDMAAVDLPLIVGENRFDLLLSVWSLYNMETNEQLEQAFKNTYKMLAPGGKACFLLCDDHKVVETGLGKIIEQEVKEVVKGDWSGPTAIRKLLSKTCEVFDYWRPYAMHEEAAKKAGYSRVEKVETLFDERGLTAWSSDDWQKIKDGKPMYAIVASQ